MSEILQFVTHSHCQCVEGKTLMFSNMLFLLHFLLPSLVISCFDSTGVARSSFSYMLCALIKIKCLSIRMTLSLAVNLSALSAYEIDFVVVAGFSVEAAFLV